jgi:hypothetical protein
VERWTEIAGSFRYEAYGRSEVTVFDFGDRLARTGRKRDEVLPRASGVGSSGPCRTSTAALDRLPEVRKRWPWPDWPKPAGLQPNEEEIVYPAFLLAAGRSVETVDQVVRKGRE